MSLRDSLYGVYVRLEKRIVPELRSSQDHYRDTLSPYVTPGCDWLDLGCGHSVFGTWMVEDEKVFTARAGAVVGIDLDMPGLKAHQGLRHKVYGDLQYLPFPSGHFDVVTANMVVEHLPAPARILAEIRRVLKPGGVFVFHTTNIGNPIMRLSAKAPQWLKNRLALLLEGRAEEDVFKTFYQLNSPEAVRRQAAHTGFTPEQINLVSTSALTQMILPAVFFELLFIRMLRNRRFEHLRTNLIGVLRTRAATEGQSEQKPNLALRQSRPV